MELRAALVDGRPVEWLERGSGMPLVLLHGTPASPQLWRDVTPRIADARCLALDLVSLGATGNRGGDHALSLSAQADLVAMWLDRVGIGRAVLAGHGLGGGVAQILAVRNPEFCAGLFLANTAAYNSPLLPAMRALRGLRGAIHHLPNPLFRLLMRWLIRRGHEAAERAEAALAVHWPHYARNGGARTFARQVGVLDVCDMLAIADGLTRLRVPTRLVWGTGDDVHGTEYGERLAQDLRAPLRRIEGAKHFTPEDYPDITAGQINLLLEQVRGARPGQ